MDFGSEVGNSIPYFRKYFPSSFLTCADVSQRCLDVSRSRYPGSEAYATITGECLPFADNSFDVVFSACVFHHIAHEQHVYWLRELSRVTIADGWLFIFEHNPWNPLTVSAVRTCPFDENAILISGRTFSKRIAAAHWSDVHVRYRMFFPRVLAMLRTLEPYLCSLPLGSAILCLRPEKRELNLKRSPRYLIRVIVTVEKSDYPHFTRRRVRGQRILLQKSAIMTAKRLTRFFEVLVAVCSIGSLL